MPEDFEIDFSAIEAEVDAEFADSETDSENVEQNTDSDTENTDNSGTETEQTQSETDTKDNVSQETTEKRVQTPEENAKFREERQKQQLAEAKKYEQFLKKLAEDNGLSVDDLMKQYSEAQLQKQAEAQKVPVEVLKQLNAQKDEINQLKEQNWRTNFNNQAASVKDKHNLNDADMQRVMNYIADNQVDYTSPTFNFENAYKLAFMDEIVQRQVDKALQDSLEAKKKRQESAALPNDSGTTSTNTEDWEDMDDAEFIKKHLSDYL